MLQTSLIHHTLQVQTKIPAAIAALHNFIRTWDPDDLATGDDDLDDSDSTPDDLTSTHSISISPENLGGHITAAEKARASAKRDEIAKAMWEDYLEERHIRGEI